jgi:hypothetical protein
MVLRNHSPSIQVYLDQVSRLHHFPSHAVLSDSLSKSIDCRDGTKAFADLAGYARRASTGAPHVTYVVFCSGVVHEFDDVQVFHGASVVRGRHNEAAFDQASVSDRAVLAFYVIVRPTAHVTVAQDAADAPVPEAGAEERKDIARRPWSIEDDEALLLWTGSVADFAAQHGRTTSSVRMRKSRLRRREGNPDAPRERPKPAVWEMRPAEAGERRPGEFVPERLGAPLRGRNVMGMVKQSKAGRLPGGRELEIEP